MSNKLIRIQLRLAGFALLLATVFFVSAAFKAKQTYSDIWQQLGITRIKGEENIRNSFLNGYFNYYGAEKAKNIITANRAGVAKDLLNYTRQQVNSESFKKEYLEMRHQAKPEEPTEKLKTKEEIRKEKIAEIERSLSESAKTIKEYPDMAKTLEPVVDMLKSTLKDYKDPNSQNIEAYYQSEIYENQSRIKRYQERMKEWEKQYPADHKILIKERLQKFIALAQTVDFNAELKTVGNKKKFVKPEYEAKPYDWKQVYRAGREVIEPSVAFAKQWLAEL